MALLIVGCAAWLPLILTPLYPDRWLLPAGLAFILPLLTGAVLVLMIDLDRIVGFRHRAAEPET